MSSVRILTPNHPDFNLPWIKAILATPNLTYTSELPAAEEFVSNALFNQTLAIPTAIKARFLFRRPSAEPDAVAKHEDCMIASIGSGLDGALGRAHGGLSSLLLDQVLGTCAQREGGTVGKMPCATATLTVEYKNPIATPTVLLLRAWMTELKGRKIFVRGVIEDGEGKVFATAKALFINPRPAVL